MEIQEVRLLEEKRPSVFSKKQKLLYSSVGFILGSVLTCVLCYVSFSLGIASSKGNLHLKDSPQVMINITEQNEDMSNASDKASIFMAKQDSQVLIRFLQDLKNRSWEDFQNIKMSEEKITDLVQNLKKSSCKDQILFDLDLAFDSTSQHEGCYISSDNHTLSNWKSCPESDGIAKKPPLQPNTGAMTNKCFELGSKVYFEISYEYELLGNFEGTLPVLDFRFAENNFTQTTLLMKGNISESNWSFVINKCHDHMCLYARNKSTTGDKVVISNVTMGTFKNGTLGVFINRVKNTLSLIDLKIQEKLFTIKNVRSPYMICPVFRIYNGEQIVKAKIRLLSSIITLPYRSLTKMPTKLVDELLE